MRNKYCRTRTKNWYYNTPIKLQNILKSKRESKLKEKNMTNKSEKNK